MLDHPVIRNCELTGYPDGREVIPICPVCGEQCETIYKDTWGDIVGCDQCITAFDAVDIMGELEVDNEW